LKLDPAGLHPLPQRKSPIDLEQLAVAFQGIGDGAATFFRLLSNPSRDGALRSARRRLTPARSPRGGASASVRGCSSKGP
jgi:hypothetical protein